MMPSISQRNILWNKNTKHFHNSMVPSSQTWDTSLFLSVSCLCKLNIFGVFGPLVRQNKQCDNMAQIFIFIYCVCSSQVRFKNLYREQQTLWDHIKLPTDRYCVTPFIQWSVTGLDRMVILYVKCCSNGVLNCYLMVDYIWIPPYKIICTVIEDFYFAHSHTVRGFIKCNRAIKVREKSHLNWSVSSRFYWLDLAHCEIVNG